MFLQAGARYIGAVGAAQILDVQTVIAQEDMRVTA